MNYFLLKITSIVFIIFTYGSSVWANEFLPTEQAFIFKAKVKGLDSVQVSFDIAPNYYMYKDEFNFSIFSPDASVIQNGEIEMPAFESKFDENFNKVLPVYRRKFIVNLPIKNTTDSASLFKVVVKSRGCADQGLCYPPRMTQAVLTLEGTTKESNPNKVLLKKNINASSEKEPVLLSDKGQLLNKSSILDVSAQSKTQLPDLATAKKASMSLDNSAYARNVFLEYNPIVALLIIFGLGLLLSLTPCMLPMIPVLSAMLAGQNNVTRGRGFFLALAYVTGMALIYAFVGMIAAETGSGLFRYLQTPWLLAAFSLLLIFLALSLFDIFQLQLPSEWQQWISSKTQGRSGYFGAALFGATSALIASPCVTAPLIGVITYIAQTGKLAFGGLALFLLAYGMGVPLLLLGAGFERLVPKTGVWMLRMKQLIGVLMLATALWIAQPLWSKHWQAVWNTSQSSLVFNSVSNSADLDAIVSQSHAPVLLDLYADWCRSCIEMEHKTFSDPAVINKLNQMTLVRVDMTEYTDDHAEILQRFSLYGPPAVIVLSPLGEERLRVIGFESASVFLGHIDTVLP